MNPSQICSQESGWIPIFTFPLPRASAMASSSKLLGGLMAGVLYSLVALGFVLIFKASGVFNFAQGAMVLFAALTLVRLMEMLKHTFSPLLIALVLTFGVMIALACDDRAHRAATAGQSAADQPVHGHAGHLVCPGRLRPGGLGQRCLHARRRHPKRPIDAARVGGARWRAGAQRRSGCGGDRRLCWLRASACSFRRPASAARCARWRTIIRRRSRSAFHSTTSGSIVWTVAGLVALVAGMVWGAQARRAVFAGLGRAEGAAGADPRRFRIDPRRGRRRADHRRRREAGRGLSRPLVGGGIENWFAYVLALVFLLIRPEGLFGEKHIDRV